MRRGLKQSSANTESALSIGYELNTRYKVQGLEIPGKAIRLRIAVRTEEPKAESISNKMHGVRGITVTGLSSFPRGLSQAPTAALSCL